MKRRTRIDRRFMPIVPFEKEPTARASDFGIEPDRSYTVSVPSANDIAAKVTITLPYVRWLRRPRVHSHESH